MTNDEGRKPEGAPERSPKAGEGAPSGVDGNSPKRFSVQRKMAIVARLLRGEPLDVLARQTNVSVARLTDWRDRTLEIKCLGIEASPSFVREPEGNGVAERFIRTLKENLLWVRSFDTIEERRAALVEFATHRA